MGPVGGARMDESGPAPAMISSSMWNQATPSPSRASIASMNHCRPVTMCSVRTGYRSDRLVVRGLGKTRDLDGALPRQRHAHGGAGRVFADRPQRVVDDADAAAFATTTDSFVRKSAIGVGRRNQAADEIAAPQLRLPCASTSAVSRLATAPPCRPAKGPAASGVGRQWFGVQRFENGKGSSQR